MSQRIHFNPTIVGFSIGNSSHQMIQMHEESGLGSWRTLKFDQPGVPDTISD